MSCVTEIKSCRACGSPRLTALFSLGEQYVSNFVKQEEIHSGVKCPIQLVLCDECTLVQLAHTAPQDFMYTRHYWYRSGVTDSMRAALIDITSEIESFQILNEGDIVLDIGSNDGTLLRSYEASVVTVGIEPAVNLADEGKVGVTHFVNKFWSKEAYDELDLPKAKVITAIGMFYDLEDPNQFIGDIADSLDDDGLFVAQLMCLTNMLRLRDVGNLAHEHLEFYSLESLRVLLGKHGLEIFALSQNAVNGQSYRLYIRKIGSSLCVTPRGGDKLQEELAAESTLTLDFYKEFFDGIESQKKATVDFVSRAVRNGSRVWVYGASTKGNVILQYYGLDHALIEGAADRSPEKHGLYTIGTGIQIHSESWARKVNPNYFLVLPYAFLNEFLERERTWRYSGGRFIVPVPSFRII